MNQYLYRSPSPALLQNFSLIAYSDPIVPCFNVPRPLYQPANDLVVPVKICFVQHCIRLVTINVKSRTSVTMRLSMQMVVSSLRVLVRDVFLLSNTNGIRLGPRLALGLVLLAKMIFNISSNTPVKSALSLGSCLWHHPMLYKQRSLTIFGLLFARKELDARIRLNSGHIKSSLRWNTWPWKGKIKHCVTASEPGKYYFPGNAELHFGRKATGIKNLIKELSGRSLKEAPEDWKLPLRWKGRKPFRSVHSAKKYFKTVLSPAFTDSGRREIQFELHPEAYLIKKGNVCLGILNGTEIRLQKLNVIGDVSMQNRMVIYDNEKQVIGWSPANCDHLPGFKSET
ncbi:hypothetical protein V6N12_059662 [Hibiscus sabdariffa]|uniref:Xylanase inhibitor C-terminal domain-containing protein n=1 Tax=Hibiscus sabdariffa TaxID=183260 RepID=A0ABR2EVR1_9ROSI